MIERERALKQSREECSTCEENIVKSDVKFRVILLRRPEAFQLSVS